MVRVIRAALAGRAFLRRSRGSEGLYQLDWSAIPSSGSRAPAGRTVARLRVLERLLVGFTDPVDDALFLTAALRRLGVAASFCLGREVAPAVPPAGFFAWVQCADEVISTSLPVQEEYIQVYRWPAGRAQRE